MTLRATRQYVEVLALPATSFAEAGTDHLSLAQIAAVERLHAGYAATDALTLAQTAAVVVYDPNVTAAHTLTLAQTAAVELVHAGYAAAHTLTLAQIASAVKARRVWAVNALVLADTLSVEKVKRAADVLTLADAVTVERALAGLDRLTLTGVATGVLGSGRASDTLALGSVATVQAVWNRRRTDTLTLTDVAGARTASIDLAAHDRLTIADITAIKGPRYLSASDVLSLTGYAVDPLSGLLVTTVAGLRDAALFSNVPDTPRLASHRLSFGEVAKVVVVHAGAVAVSASDTLAIAHGAYRNASPLGSSALVLSDAAAVLLTRPFVDVLALVDLAQVHGVFNVSASDSLVLEQSLGFVEARQGWLYRYHPFIGSGARGAPTPPPATLVYTPATGVGAGTLVYPATPPYIDQLILRSPDLGNKDRLHFNRVSRETRGGTLIVFADPIWPKVQVQVLTWGGLTQTQARWVLDFMANHLGEEVGFIDWEQRRWVGVITNTTDPVVQDGRSAYTASLEFEGALAP